ncbi:MAG: NAD(P)H-dependent glycerol-3-phosphate dehydrogenase [Candidatus Omnitrophota bacterium]|jgi:glycerol-3-phosphate dehydrogenase (NAD(P)+)
MTKKKKIAIIGDGGWGTTLGVVLCNKGFDITLWGLFPDNIDLIKSRNENVKFLAGIKIPAGMKPTCSMDEALNGADAVILAVPSQFLRSILEMLKMHRIDDIKLISVVKGIENTTLKRMSEVIVDVLGKRKIVVLSGPTIALEVANGSPTTAVAASEDMKLAEEVQEIFRTERLRIYTSSDVVGVELGGSIKNIVAIAAGVCDGLGYGSNAKAALLTRGLVEIVRLGTAMGARKETFYGLAGLGDLATTCVSQYSRNRWLGEEIGKGKKLADILRGTDMVVEGVATAKSVYDLSKKYKVEMPITEEVYKVLYENKDPQKAVRDLMTRAPKDESRN